MRTVLHIGFHKTATTMLQRSVFPRLADTAYAGPSVPPSVFVPLSENLRKADERDYLGRALAGYLEDVSRDAKALVVSEEGFSLLSSGRRTAERLAALLPDAHVLVCVRDQRAMLRSLYYMYLTRGGCASLGEWITTDDFRVERLEYHRSIGTYVDLYGRDRVRTVVYEELVRDPLGFVRDVAAYVRPDDPPDLGGWTVPLEHRSLSAAGRAVLRAMNRLLVRSPYNPNPPLGRLGRGGVKFRVLRGVDNKVLRHLPVDAADPPAFTEWVLPVVRESNAELVRLTGLDLASYGYPLP